jgi:hypothetical protein
MADNTRTEQHAALLRSIAERLGLEPVKTLIRVPGMRALLRLTVYYHDRRALDAVGTLAYNRTNGIDLAVRYRGVFANKPLHYPYSENRYEGLSRALAGLHFDHLKDQPYLPLYGLDFWLIERAAGGFVHSVIVAPQSAVNDHARLVTTIKTYLPEVLKEINTS